VSDSDSEVVKGMVDSVVKMISRQVAIQVVGELSKRYGFDREDAEKGLNLGELRVSIIENKKPKKGSLVLPFCGEIMLECCNGIRLNHGLYTQCVNEISDHTGRHPVCSTCSKQIEKNSNGEPTYGYVTTRLDKGENFRDPKGKCPVNYGNVMEKLNISKVDAVKAATELGWTIPECQFEVKRATRGRPKKDATTVDTASEISEEDADQTEKKQRGRPKKDKKVVSSNTGDDMIAGLVEKANKEAEEAEEEEEEEEEEAVQAQPIKMMKNTYIVLESKDGEAPPGTTHLINPIDNTLYHPETHDPIGTWNPETKRIDPLVESDED
jgi:hypothetical protein